MTRPEVIRKRFNKTDDYLEVDRAIVYDVLQNRLSDIEEIKKAFAAFL